MTKFFHLETKNPCNGNLIMNEVTFLCFKNKMYQNQFGFVGKRQTREEQIDFFLFHQASKFVVEELRKELKN